MSEELEGIALRLARHERWRWRDGMIGIPSPTAILVKVDGVAVLGTRWMIWGPLHHKSAETMTVSEDRAAGQRWIMPDLASPAMWGWLVAMLVAEGIAPLDPWEGQDPDDDHSDAAYGARLGILLMSAWDVTMPADERVSPFVWHPCPICGHDTKHVAMGLFGDGAHCARCAVCGVSHEVTP